MRRTDVSTTSRRRGASLATSIAAACVAAMMSAPAAASAPPPDTDPALQQRIEADEAVATGAVVVAGGHIDIGPRLIDDRWQLLARDDSVVPSVWRSLDDVVLHVTDAAILPVPDDPAYSFVGAAPGANVHVVPQTQAQDVVWVGWNTQDPDVIQTIDRGATLTMQRVEGPGQMTMYLQSGNFSEPDVLWTSAEPGPQSIWVDVNTHTHANWVFTEPGVYLVEVEIAADLVTGEHVSDVRTLRIAVGDATDPATARVPATATGSTPTTVSPTTTTAPDESDSTSRLPIVAGAAALVLAAGGLAVALRGRQTKRRADADRRPGDRP